MAVTQVGSSWFTSYLGDHALFDHQADATTADTALAAVATDPPTFASTAAGYLAHMTGGNWGHIKTLAAPDPVALAGDLATDLSTIYLPLAPVQRGVWAPTTTYALADIAISPTGDIITPKVAFTSAAAYSAANWNILIPAQNYGRELTAAESSADLNLLSTAGSWTDVPGMTGTIPAGIPFVAEITAICAALQGTAAAGSIVDIQSRLVDSATATTVYAFAWKQFYFPVAGQSATQWGSVATFRRQAALGSSTAVKLQATTAVVTNAGNRGLFPATGGSTEPTTFMVRGR